MEDPAAMESANVAVDNSENQKTIEIKETKSRRKREVPVKFVSFNDYHALWRGIATSIVNYDKPRENDCKFLLLSCIFYI